MPKIILISGKARSGKDTFANYFKEEAELNNKRVLIIKYADILKFICEKYFNWNREKDEEEFSIGKTCDDKVVEKINKFIIENEKLKVDCLVIGKHEEINRLLLKITTEGK